jgi:hypothetical protein
MKYSHLKNTFKNFSHKFWATNIQLRNGVLRLVLELNGENYNKSKNHI